MFDFYFTGVPHSSQVADFIIDNEACVLLSQLNERGNINRWLERLKNTDKKPKLFIDSGAFSAWTKGKEIDVDGYIEFINTNKDYFTVCASVDNIPGVPRSSYIASPEDVKEAAEKTWENYLYMRSKMEDINKLLYTFHVGEPWEFLKQALEYKDERGHIPYIGLGGMVGKTKEIITSFLDEAYNIIDHSSNPKVKVHAFGMTRADVLEMYPLTSADSTSWLQTANFGQITIGQKSICISDRKLLSSDSIFNKNALLKEEVTRIANSRGFTLEQLSEDSNARLMFNVYNFYDWAKNYTCKRVSKKKKVSLW